MMQERSPECSPGRGERSYWRDIPQVFATMAPPLRPPPSVVAAMSEWIVARSGTVLLMGVTPELAALGQRLVAVDRHRAMVDRHWPGDGAGRRVVIADWRNLPLADASIDSVVGDGCMTVLPSSDRARVFAELSRVLRPGGRVVLRLFCAPDRAESVEQVVADAMQGRIANFWAFRWRLMMAAAALHPGHDLAVTAGWHAFDAAVSDRDALARATGWTRALIDTMDRYRDSSDVYCFAPTETGYASVPDGFSSLRLAPTRGYDLAERCPLLIVDRAT